MGIAEFWSYCQVDHIGSDYNEKRDVRIEDGDLESASDAAQENVVVAQRNPCARHFAKVAKKFNHATTTRTFD